MDPVALAFYAVICGLLGLAGPRLGSGPMRFGVGAFVGIVAAAALPLIKRALGLA